MKQPRPREFSWQNQESRPQGLPVLILPSSCPRGTHLSSRQPSTGRLGHWDPTEAEELFSGALGTQWRRPGEQAVDLGRDELGATPVWEGLETFWEHRGEGAEGRKVLGALQWQLLCVSCSLRPRLRGHTNLRLLPAGWGCCLRLKQASGLALHSGLGPVRMATAGLHVHARVE